MKYIAYCRKSTNEKDRQILSIEAQIAELTEFAKREGLEIAEFITEAKNTSEELAFFGKTVGSNFFLTDRRLAPELKKGFAELWLTLTS